MLSNPNDFKGMKFALKSLNDDYQTMNKIVHYNIRPKGSKKKLGSNEIAFLYVVMKKRVFDASKKILEVMKDFRTMISKQSLMPFSCMIFHFCVGDKVKRYVSAMWDDP